ncbi:helix-turn-helix domain-containing protein [Streptomyces sp. NBC_00063]|uniref:helix-turn-helix domain-containing protein n=1 Tax=Streptomyces sp. NBC_00063 TaxID=2975638 RepID=UPI002251FEEB|nr:helix-turn-helix domain-containing protein [Streptomyces sp. NBC_00063]MCX5443816.1 helix-turn-helix domain-containing protein [Streptomyces sp. NBC_00063]
MDAHEVNRVRAKLALYVADVFASVPRKDQRAKGDCYLQGLMLLLTARQEASGLVRIRQKDLAKRLDISQAAVSRAIGQLKDKGILDGRHRQGTVLIRPLLAAYESLAHMINHLQDPTTFVWPLNHPTGEIRPPRTSGGRLHFAGRCPARPGGPTVVRSAAYGALTQHAEVRVGDTVFATGAVGAAGTLAGPHCASAGRQEGHREHPFSGQGRAAAGRTGLRRGRGAGSPADRRATGPPRQ